MIKINEFSNDLIKFFLIHFSSDLLILKSYFIISGHYECAQSSLPVHPEPVSQKAHYLFILFF